ncbi:iron(III) transport system ATP-binding protein [Tepidamorphus gemmatus]|uniref:Iron(III) transport system ATP-binding protein n=1 Tax=Tepidamorphus gemmatus TaxID=747076 RepID=A0A4R3M2I9_9HYPH|nr:putative 2-aminoethylphosphonate ABC transporter ATP-binding protein [Tepidamorphus gemmatus]TCT06429.1 iron(III) transport system ATP-binding protein [Tepidamorphus gemmatus]
MPPAAPGQTAYSVAPPHDGPYLAIENVTKRFGGFAALKGVSLEVAHREFVCFLGPSGCGKTTLLRAIAGLDIQTSGRIHQGGRDISALPPGERDFGIVFQSYALFPNLTIRRNVAYGLENRGLRRADIRRRVDELLDLVGLTDQAEKYPAQLSGGQQQRVALARALAPSPGLLLLDEPLSALDAKVRARLRFEIKKLQRTLGITTIMVTHDQEEALTMADRIVVMNQGTIEQVGSPMQIYATPASTFVADFIGTMNFAPGVMAGPGRLHAYGAELACDEDGIPTGTPVTVAIRPEDIELGTQHGRNVVAGEIAWIEFLGSFVRLGLHRTGTGEAGIRIDLPIARARQMALQEGTEVSFALPADRLRLYPESARG